MLDSPFMSASKDKIFIQGLQARCIIGIFDWERKVRQKITIDLEFPADIRKAARRDSIEDTADYKKIAKHTLSFIGKSKFFLVETLAEKLAAELLKKFGLSEIKICLSKPGALRFCKNVGIEITRQK